MALEVKLFATIEGSATVQLEIDRGDPILMQRQLYELTDIDKQLTGVTKTMLLPSTQINDDFFFSFKNVNGNAFDPYVTCNADIYVDDEAVMSGDMYLKNYERLDDIYEIVIAGKLGTLKATLGAKTLADMSQGRLDRWQHKFNLDSVLTSWSSLVQLQEGRVVYPVSDNGLGYGFYNKMYEGSDDVWYNLATEAMQCNNFRPGVKLIEMLTDILEDNGYTIDLDFMNVTLVNNLLKDAYELLVSDLDYIRQGELSYSEGTLDEDLVYTFEGSSNPERIPIIQTGGDFVDNGNYTLDAPVFTGTQYGELRLSFYIQGVSFIIDPELYIRIFVGLLSFDFRIPHIVSAGDDDGVYVDILIDNISISFLGQQLVYFSIYSTINNPSIIATIPADDFVYSFKGYDSFGGANGDDRFNTALQATTQYGFVSRFLKHFNIAAYQVKGSPILTLSTYSQLISNAVSKEVDITSKIDYAVSYKQSSLVEYVPAEFRYTYQDPESYLNAKILGETGYTFGEIAGKADIHTMAEPTELESGYSPAMIASVDIPERTIIRNFNDVKSISRSAQTPQLFIYKGNVDTSVSTVLRDNTKYSRVSFFPLISNISEDGVSILFHGLKGYEVGVEPTNDVFNIFHSQRFREWFGAEYTPGPDAVIEISGPLLRSARVIEATIDIPQEEVNDFEFTNSFTVTNSHGTATFRMLEIKNLDPYGDSVATIKLIKIVQTIAAHTYA